GLADLALHSCRDAEGDDTSGQIPSNDPARADDRVFADRHAVADNGPAAEPDVVADHDRLCRLPSQPARLGIHRVRRGDDVDSRRDLAGSADSDRRDVEHHAAEVDERPGADRYAGAVVAVKRRAYDDAIAD